MIIAGRRTSPLVKCYNSNIFAACLSVEWGPLLLPCILLEPEFMLYMKK